MEQPPVSRFGSSVNELRGPKGHQRVIVGVQRARAGKGPEFHSSSQIGAEEAEFVVKAHPPQGSAEFRVP